jgi:hypothetical protein
MNPMLDFELTPAIDISFQVLSFIFIPLLPPQRLP